MEHINTWPGWECVRKIGEGSFGKVYEIQKVENETTYYTAALKVISIPQNEDELENAYSSGLDEEGATRYFQGFVDDISSEIVLMSHLKGYTNIVSYEDHMVIKHQDDIGWDILIRMELLTPLQRWVKEHPMTEKDVIRLGCDICRALELCHKNRIIHRDIKPQNIFVNQNGDFKLGDFGIARVVEDNISVRSQKGTYTYMAPEVFKGQHYDETADLYSLGIVLYRFLNQNRTPFLPMEQLEYSDQQIAFNRRMEGDEIPAPKNGSAELKRTILKAIQYDADKRYQGAKEFYEALVQCVNPISNTQQETTAVQIESSNTDSGKSKKRLYMIFACLAVCLGIVLLMVTSRTRHNEAKTDGSEPAASEILETNTVEEENALLYTPIATNYWDYSETEDSEALCFFDGESTISFNDVNQIEYSGNKEKVAIVIPEGGLIYLLSEGGTVQDIVADASDVKISFNGNALAFRQQENLYWYAIKNEGDDYEMISCIENVEEKQFALSSNGKYLLYSENNQAENKLYCMFVEDESTIKVAEDVVCPLAVSDSGDAFFYIGNDKKLYYADKEKQISLSDFSIIDITSEYPCFFNESCDEVIYLDGGITKYYTAGDSESKVIGDIDTYATPYVFETMASQTISTRETEDWEYYNIRILGIKSFANSVLYDGKLFYWLDEYANHLKQIDSGDDPLGWLRISSDLKRMVYMKANRIYELSTENLDDITCIYENDQVIRLSASLDLNEIYFETNTGEIKYMGKDREVKTLIEISDIYYGRYNEQQKAYVVCTENMELYHITAEKQTMLSEEACLVSIPRMGPVTYTVYNGEKKELYMLLDNQLPKSVYNEGEIHMEAENTMETSKEDESDPRRQTTNYQRMHDASEYEDLMLTMEICFLDETFENLEEIEDLGFYNSWFITEEYSEEYESWHMESSDLYAMPGEAVRNTLCKYFAFDELNLADYIPTQPTSTSGEWYDVENDIYYGYIGGFGGTRDGYSEITFEILEYRVVKATGFWTMEDGSLVTTEIVVEESEEGYMRLKSYTHTVGEPVAYSLEELEQMARDYRTRHGLYECTVAVDSEFGDDVLIHCYDVIIDDPVTGDGRISTSDWYTVNRYTAVGTDAMGGYVDLKN